MKRHSLSAIAATAVVGIAVTATTASTQAHSHSDHDGVATAAAAHGHGHGHGHGHDEGGAHDHEGGLIAGPSMGRTTQVGVPLTTARSAQADQEATSTFQVTYEGFTPEAKAAFQRAVDIWSTKLVSSVPITVKATFAQLDPKFLGQAAPGEAWGRYAGAEENNKLYVGAIANKQHGKQINAGSDIVANFANRTDWHYGEGPAPADKYDFTTVVMHELGHGLGFTGFGQVTNGRGSLFRVTQNTKIALSYDHWTSNGSGVRMVSFPDNSTALAAQLQSNNLYFIGPKTRAANNNVGVRLYAPSPWQDGSSYAHLDEASYQPGDPNSLMTPALNKGETIRDPGPFTLAIYDDIGW